MNWKKEWRSLALIAGVFLGVYFLPVGKERFDLSVIEALELAKWYAREHVLLCLIPAFFIAGAIGVFVSQGSVMKYLGAGAKKIVAYTVASVSGSVLAVCSCTVLPLFAGIYRMGAGLGPATAFLYAGPAINVLAIILTARILGLELGIARAVGAVVFSILIGLLMHLLFRKDEKKRQAAVPVSLPGEGSRALWKNAIFFFILVAIMVAATWGGCNCTDSFQNTIYGMKQQILSVLAVVLGVVLVVWMKIKLWKISLLAAVVVLAALVFPEGFTIPFVAGMLGLSVVLATGGGEGAQWFEATFGFARQILPLLLAGVLVAGLLLGRAGYEGLIPSSWIETAVGGNSLRANLLASVAGAFMYFATLTEIPILQGLMGSGMGKGPALALLLAGPALSLPNMLVIRSVMGTKKTVAFVALVVVMATVSGIVFGKM
ncbi:MAG: permease [Candidatus Fermentibacteraceae bacterium]|nr:permease [Candidatus Fermentibacteraceae bacterium]